MKLDPQPEDLPITVSVRGDTNVKFTAESAFTFQKGSKWSDVKARIEKKITYSDGYENAGWKLNDTTGQSLTDAYRFMANTTVFVESKKIPVAQVTITVAGDTNVAFKTEVRSFKIDKAKTWADAKKHAEALITYKTGFEHDAWKLNNGSGSVISDGYQFNTDITLYAVSKQAAAPPVTQITITVAGDEHAVPKAADHTFNKEPGTKWETIKLLANSKIDYAAHYENDTWKLNDASGEVIPDDYQFNTDTTVYAVSKQKTAVPKPQITITITAGEHVRYKTAGHNTITIPKNETWAHIKELAAETISYDEGYENDTWKFNNVSGEVISDAHQFNADTTVYVTAKQTIIPNITITVAGDTHVTLKAEKTFTADKGKTWHQLKVQAEDRIDHYEAGHGLDKWTLTDAGGQNLTEDYVFNTNATVFIVTKQTSAPPPAKITITVEGDINARPKADHIIEVPPGTKWDAVKTTADSKIDYTPGYENKTWKRANASGGEISADYQFNADTVVYAESKRKTIIITVMGDGHTFVDTVSGANKIDRPYGVEWSDILIQAGNAITGYDENYAFSTWKFKADGTGAAIQPTYKFTADTTVYAISKRTHVILTIQGDTNVIIPNDPYTYRIDYDSKWEDHKADIETLLNYQNGFKLKGWKLKKADGQDLKDTYKFRDDTVIYALSKSDKVKITVRGDEHVQIKPAPDNEFIADDGTKWTTIKDEAAGKITGYTPRHKFSSWRIGAVDGEYIDEDTPFEKDTIVYAVTEELPAVSASEGIKIDTVTITGKTSSSPLPANADDSWKGVFPTGRNVTLSKYTIGKYEVTVKLWDEVYLWAKENDYAFDFDDDGHEENPPPENHPITKVSWRDCIVWCNAYTELTYGNTDHCVYRESSAPGAEVLKDAEKVDNAYFDQSKKGYRLPTEAEWEYAARYQDNDTNAEIYGGVYLTNVNSASGAIKPIGFKDMVMSAGESYETLRAETSRVAVFNKYYDGSAFVPQNPSITGLSDVGKKTANKLGIHDMSGNASEWCWDRYSATLSSGSVTDPTGSLLSSDTKRVLRGGNWSENDEKAVYGCMTGKRDNDSSDRSYDVVGFRLVWQEE